MVCYTVRDTPRTVITPERSTAEGPTIKGKRIEERVMTILTGRMRSRVGGEERIRGPGEAVHIPANVEHESWASAEEVEFISCKDVIEPSR